MYQGHVGSVSGHSEVEPEDVGSADHLHGHSEPTAMAPSLLTTIRGHIREQY